MENKKYKVVIAQSGKLDVKEKKKYILQQFKYREYAENFSKKIKKAVLALDTLPTGYNTTGFRYRGYDIYMKDSAEIWSLKMETVHPFLIMWMKQ